MPGPVEKAIRNRVNSGNVLATPGPKRAPFVVESIGRGGIVLLLGKKRAVTPLSWECLEGVPGFLRGKGWVEPRQTYSVKRDPTTLDGYFKGCIKRATANWVVVVLEKAGVVNINRESPLRVKLAPGW
jgi:hypothetical protein